LDWPVSIASDLELQESNKLKSENEIEVENIDFQEKWNRAAGDKRLGWINVRKLKNISLEEYVKEIDKETILKSLGREIIVPAPKITFTTIGGEKAILVESKSELANFSKSIFDYRVVRNGLLYRFVVSASERFLENKEENSTTFQKIISTVEFNN